MAPRPKARRSSGTSRSTRSSRCAIPPPGTARPGPGRNGSNIGRSRIRPGDRTIPRPGSTVSAKPATSCGAGSTSSRRRSGNLRPRTPAKEEAKRMRVGVLTGGGDAPGLNAVIRAIVRKGEKAYSDEVIGFADGWRGVLEGMVVPLTSEGTRGILPRGGTILGTSRTNPFKLEGGPEQVEATIARLGIDALIAIGGEDTLGVAQKLFGRVSVVGVPKTIDNDLSGTEVTFGFDTAVQIAVDAIDRLHTTAESHNRVLIVEVMGRHAGWIALHSGLAGGANVILIPERPFDIDEVCAYIEKRFARHYAPIVVVAEGATPKEGTMSLQQGDL